jgi:serine/threonine protein kinase
MDSIRAMQQPRSVEALPLPALLPSTSPRQPQPRAGDALAAAFLDFVRDACDTVASTAIVAALSANHTAADSAAVGARIANNLKVDEPLSEPDVALSFASAGLASEGTAVAALELLCAIVVEHVWNGRQGGATPCATPVSPKKPQRFRFGESVTSFPLEDAMTPRHAGGGGAGGAPPQQLFNASLTTGPTALSTPAAYMALRSAAMSRSTHFADSATSMTLKPQTTDTFEAEVSAPCYDGTCSVNQYVLLHEIGQGSQGEVMLAMDTDKNELRAVKVMPQTATTAAAGVRTLETRRNEQMQREIAVMKKCRHRNIVALYEVIDDPAANSLYLVMQYVEHGSIQTRLEARTKALRPSVLVDYARQLCAGLQYLHNHGVVHRDIKPDNILLGNDDVVYLADFGVSDTLGDDNCMAGNRGTKAFFAPELLGVDVVGADLDGKAADVWAMGMSLYALLYGRLPWPVDHEYLFKVVTEEPDLPAAAPCGAALDDRWLALLRGMLHAVPAERWTLHAVRDCLKQLQRATTSSAAREALTTVTYCATEPRTVRHDASPVLAAPALETDPSCISGEDRHATALQPTAPTAADSGASSRYRRGTAAPLDGDVASPWVANAMTFSDTESDETDAD